MTATVIFLTSGTSWTVPADWDSAANTIELIGAGGGGGSSNGVTSGSGGGGGGAFAKKTNATYTPGVSVAYVIGVGGKGADTAGNATHNGLAGTDTTFDTGTYIAKGGDGGQTAVPPTGGAGGAAASCLPASGAFSGGNGAGNSLNTGAGGGGGAGGPNGTGGNGAAYASGQGGGGGGGSDGGGNGLVGTGGKGGDGGIAFDSTAGGLGGGSGGPSGAGGASGSHGSGGGGGISSSSASGGDGGNGIGWVQTSNSAVAGPGGGGGAGSGGGSSGGGGGLYGGGGGGNAAAIGSNTGGPGRNGLIVITYTPNTSLTATLSSTLSGATLSSTATAPNGATLSKTLAGVTLTATAGSTVSASLSSTLSGVTLNATSGVPNQAVLAQTLQGLTSSITATAIKSLVDSGRAIAEYYWQAVAGSGTLNFVAQQIGKIVYFYKVGATEPLSAGLFLQTLNLDDYRVAGSPLTGNIACQFASGSGYLFIAHPYCDPIYVNFDPVTNVFTFKSIKIQIRDFTGLIENPVNPVGFRPKTLNDDHHYNLINQGWFCQATEWHDGTGDFETLGLVDGYIDLFFTQMGEIGGGSVYPSNSDVWYLYKAPNGGFSPFTTLSTIGSYNSVAPKGYFLLDAFNQDRNAVYNAAAINVSSPKRITTIPVVNSGFNRPSAIAFFAGRVFYAGVSAQSFANQIYYSQIFQDPSFLDKCYQANDPTASDTGVADLVDSDGGVLVFPEMGQVYRLFPVAYSLIVLASNGVWAISGSTGSGFKATDFSVSKVSSVGMLSPQAFIDLDGTPVWWNLDGIYTLGGSNVTSPNAGAGTSAMNMTDPVIKTFIDTIPAESKKFSKGSYNRGLYTIYWLYSTIAPTDVDSRYHYTNILCLNTNTKAFYDWEIPHGTSVASAFTDMWISGIVTVQGGGTSYVTDIVTTNSLQEVFRNDGVTSVTVAREETLERQSVTKFLVQYRDENDVEQVSYAENYDTTYKDFIDLDYSSFFVSGYALDGQGIAKFQSPYIVVYSNDEDVNGFTLSSVWDFATDLILTTNKIGTPQTWTSEGGSNAWIDHKRKMRGVGKALQIKIVSVSGLPFEIAGWAIEVSTNTGP